MASNASPPTIATWVGGEVAQTEFEQWMSYLKQDVGTVGFKRSVEEWLLFNILADEVTEIGLNETTRLRIEQSEKRLLAGAYERSITSAVEISVEEIEALVLQHPEAFQRPRKVRLRNLYLPFPPQASEEERTRVHLQMADLKRKLQEGADFGELAQQESHSQSRFRKGLMGNVVAGALPPSVDAVAMDLKEGEISSVIESENGLTLLKCDGVIPAFFPSPEEVRQKLKTNLRKIRTTESWERIEAEILREAKPHYFPQNTGANKGLSKAPILRFKGGQLFAHEFEKYRKVSQPKARLLADLDPEVILDLLESWVLEEFSAQRARRNKLHLEPTMAMTIRFSTLRIKTAEGIGRRVSARFEAPTPNEVEAYFKEHQESFVSQEEFTLSAILIAIPENQQIVAQQEALSLRKKLVEGKMSFEEASKTEAAAQSTPPFGRVGSISRRQLASKGPEFMRTVLQLTRGGIGRPFVLGDSYWIVRLDEIIAPKPLTFSESQERATRKLAQERIEKLQEEIEGELIASFKVELKP